MFKNQIITAYILMFVSISIFAKNLYHPATSLHFNIPENASVTINNPSEAQLHYQCKFYSFEVSQIMFQSLQGNNRIDSISLSEGYQVYLEIQNRKETLLTIDSSGRLKLINRGTDVTLDCII